MREVALGQRAPITSAGWQTLTLLAFAVAPFKLVSAYERTTQPRLRAILEVLACFWLGLLIALFLLVLPAIR